MFEAVIFMGVQASGKSSFYRQNFFHSHMRINLDMLRTRTREKILIRACLDAKQSFVVDNTNPTREDRRRYREMVDSPEFKLKGFYFSSELENAIRLNQERKGAQLIPKSGLLATYNKLELPSYAEGFQELSYVKMDNKGGFIVSPWEKT